MAISTTRALLEGTLFRFAPRPPPKFCLIRRRHHHHHHHHHLVSFSRTTVSNFTTTSSNYRTNGRNSKTKKAKQKPRSSQVSAAVESLVKRRTRSYKEFDEDSVLRYGDSATHIPVMLGEVLEVFASIPLRSFVDCTLGAAGHSTAIIQAHPEMQLFVGLDVDPVAHEKAQPRVNAVVREHGYGSAAGLEAHTLVKNFKDIKSVIHNVDEKLLVSKVDGILMDLGMSSMQVNDAERGFGVLSNGPLDMRMNPQRITELRGNLQGIGFVD